MKNPKRQHKYHGTETKKNWLRKYRDSPQGMATAKNYYPIKKAKTKARRQEQKDAELAQNMFALPELLDETNHSLYI